jgi:hypothetical protein
MRVHYDELHVNQDYDTVCLPVSGYIYGIVVALKTPMDYSWNLYQSLNWRTGEEKSIHTENVLYTGYHESGKYFPKGLHNFNTATPYYIKLSKPHPDVIIRIFSSYEEI